MAKDSRRPSAAGKCSIRLDFRSQGTETTYQNSAFTPATIDATPAIIDPDDEWARRAGLIP